MERSVETLLDDLAGLAAERDVARPVGDYRALAQERLTALLDHLTPRHQEIIAAYYGLDGGSWRTLRAIAAPAGVSREDIRHHKARALKRMARILRQELTSASQSAQETINSALERAQLAGRLSARTLHFLRRGLDVEVLAANGSLETFRAELEKEDGGACAVSRASVQKPLQSCARRCWNSIRRVDRRSDAVQSWRFHRSG
jgi:hypothetical protein